MTRVGRAIEKAETKGFMKVVSDAETSNILGAAILGVGGDEAIHGILDIMNAGATLSDTAMGGADPPDRIRTDPDCSWRAETPDLRLLQCTTRMLRSASLPPAGPRWTSGCLITLITDRTATRDAPSQYEGDANGAPHPEASAYAKKFSGKYEHRIVTGGIGHNLPQEAPQAFAEAVVDIAKG